MRLSFIEMMAVQKIDMKISQLNYTHSEYAVDATTICKVQFQMICRVYFGLFVSQNRLGQHYLN